MSLQPSAGALVRCGLFRRLNHPKALLVSATASLSCFSGAVVKSLNHPKALLVSATATRGDPVGSRMINEVSITRRLFLSLQLEIERRCIWPIHWLRCLNHPKALLVSATATLQDALPAKGCRAKNGNLLSTALIMSEFLITIRSRLLENAITSLAYMRAVTSPIFRQNRLPF